MKRTGEQLCLRQMGLFAENKSSFLSLSFAKLLLSGHHV